MADSRDANELFWCAPETRCILPLGQFHVPRSLRKFLKSDPFEMRINTAFPEVIRACAEAAPGRKETWINQEIIALYTQLWEMGYAYSVESWQGEVLVGGLYGVTLGAAFFGESMFSRQTNASKAALVYLVQRLHAQGFLLLDAQFENPHLDQFGARSISKAEYLVQLKKAVAQRTCVL